MKLVYLGLRLIVSPLVALMVGAMAAYLWLQESYMEAIAEYHE